MFIAIGVFGALLLIVALLLDDVLDGLLPEGDWLSTTAIAVFLTAFGFGASLIDRGTGLPTVVAAAVGAAAGLALGYLAVRWSGQLSAMATDATPAATDLVGCEGHIITEVLPGRAGEALIRLAGQPLKLSAVSSGQDSVGIDRGATVVVVAVQSPTRVEVQAADDFWAD